MLEIQVDHLKAKQILAQGFVERIEARLPKALIPHLTLEIERVIFGESLDDIAMC